MEGLNQLAVEIHEWARKQGFYDNETIEGDQFGGTGTIPNPSLLAEKFALMHSEVSEALEAWRDEDDAHINEELIDVIIRVLDTLAWRGADIEQLIADKMQKNRERPHMNGRKRG